MNLLRIALLCTAMIGLVAPPAVRAEDQPAAANSEIAPEMPSVHCEGQNCLPPPRTLSRHARGKIARRLQ